MALILLPVSRFSTTWLRDKVGGLFPFDYAIVFHQVSSKDAMSIALIVVLLTF